MVLEAVILHTFLRRYLLLRCRMIMHKTIRIITEVSPVLMTC
jgi:hypothetical protein